MIAFIVAGVVALVIGLELLDVASARRRQREYESRPALETHRPRVRPVGRPAWAWVWACGCTAPGARNVGAAGTQHEACTSAGRHVRAERERTSS